ncbi:NADH-quinone oxidoreductase subunit E [Carboxydocella sporoproducens DSM 16521]|uniref:NADH-quinone oxidoreductase subunit E n=2 Tax=Carboxydocella TaxID=178898 RepID=A0A1T4MKU9_9FIRM|nr:MULTISPECIES: NADH-quinone oxidoreductase subunit NuoE [Carboxydocella]AVX21362.1 NADH-quinone oxidoreductase subunit E [Carboxydocella thermautotrophica]SJZ67378.1 NADH-quinone oxidoreductase subunit E [Carboxydocella sporoproducens DSM 16521]
MTCCQCGQTPRDPKQEQLEQVLAHYAGQKGALIPVLQEAQEIYGYLPPEVLRRISEALNIPFAKVYGVVTFYAQFHLKPRGRNIIRVCLGTACHVRGGAKIFETIQNELNIKDGETTEDLRFTLESVACIGACGLAPVIMVNDDTHGRLTPDRVKEILAQYE